MDKKEIGEILRSLRKKAKKSRKEVAEILNRSEKVVGHWETGYAQPDANTLFLLCKIYDADLNEAFGFGNSENSEGEAFSIQGISLAKKQVLESIGALTDEQVNAVSSFIKYLTNNKEIERPTPQMTVEEAEGEYIKSRSKFVQNVELTALNTIEDTDNKIAG